MKLVRYGEVGAEKPGILDPEGKIRDLSGVVKDITGDVLGPAGLKHLKSLDVSKLPRVTGNPRLGAPVGAVPKFLGIGLNYRDHAEETKAEIPRDPILFSKYATAIIGPDDPILLPAVSKEVDYEAELAFIMARRGRHIPKAQALEFVAGYTILHDVSARDYQIRKPGGQWMSGKTFDTFAPMGPALVTAEEIPDPHVLDITCRVSGELLQSSNTKHLIFSIPDIVAYCSHIFTLEPGDVIATGTPGGVGFTRKPPRFLKEGDVAVLEIQGIGLLQNPVRLDSR